jgi:hypothetical protein
VFHLIGNQWEQLGNTLTGDPFSTPLNPYSLALSNDGLTIAVGDWSSDPSFVKVFRLKNNTWQQVGQTIHAEEPHVLGMSVALSADGNIVASGSPGSFISTGSAHVFGLSNKNQWEQMGSTLLGETSYPDYFGMAMALSSDGLTLAVGACGHLDDMDSPAGQVRIFSFVNNDWQQIGQDLESKAADDWFGISVALSADGTIVAGGTGWADGQYMWVFSREPDNS